ncbi:MAG: hypothetical protein NZ840_05060 [Anaerolineales bacterium]|nr:hypothetical protein [Anaerolineales bacterium]MDW8161406.1 hypothetical protein [Anaerolineales bacterium]
MKTRFFRPLTMLVTLALVALACDLSLPMEQVVSAPTQVPVEMIYTAAAETLAAQLTQNVPPQIPPTATLPPEQQPPPEGEPLMPTFTFTPLFSETPTVTATPPFTPTPIQPSVTAKQDTNCRKGPGPIYDRVSALLVGQTALVFGRDSTSTWWYIEDPRRPGAYCWVWSGSTTVSGPTAELPVFTPPPPPATATPTAPASGVAFEISFADKHKCGADWYAYLKIKNVGPKAIESVLLKLTNVTTNTTLSSTSYDNPFLSNTNKCPPGKDNLDAGESAYIAGLIGNVPGNHELKAGVTVCTEEGLGGKCEFKAIKFNAP